MKLCDYGCGKEAKYKLKNGKWCCNKSYNSCDIARKKNGKGNKGKVGYWKGKIFSLEAREKMREAKLGEKNYMYGRRHIDEVKDATSKRNKGQRCGCENPNWKGGLSFEPYCEIWADQEYKSSIKERDNNKCLNPYCTSGKDLVIHHIDYNKKNCHPYNLITVCRSCNAKANFDREWHEAWYKAIIYRRYKI